MDYEPRKGLNKIVYILLIVAMVLSALFYAAQYFGLFEGFSDFSFSFSLPSSQKEPVQVPQGKFIKTIVPSIAEPKIESAPDPMDQPVEPSPPDNRSNAVRPEFTALMAEYNNEDIVGYLLIEDTTIDYPVFQSGDNEFYLLNNEDKVPSSAGALYLDYENDIENADRNMIIYGHNMNADIMFHSLRYYREEEFYSQHKEVIFNTLYDDYVWEVFAFYDTHVEFPYILVNFDSDSQFLSLVNQMIEKSLYDTGVSVEARDRILTLSTCTNVSDETRYVLNCRLKTVNGRPVEELWAEEDAYQQALMDYEKALEDYAAYYEEYQVYREKYEAYREDRDLYDKILNYTID